MSAAPKHSLDAVVKFLNGEAPLDGVHFGEKHPHEFGAFWWRKHLRDAVAAQQAPHGVAIPYGWVIEHGSMTTFEKGAENPWKESAGAFAVYSAPVPAPGSLGAAYREVQALKCPYTPELHRDAFNVSAHAWDEGVISVMRIMRKHMEPAKQTQQPSASPADEKGGA